MIQQIHRYDGLDKPETQKHMDINANPAQIILGVYELWFQISNKIRYEKFLKRGLEEQYQEAFNLLQPHARAFRNVKSEDLESAVSQISKRIGRNEYWERAVEPGLFLSALLNATDLQELDCNFRCEYLGYRLNKGKRILTREGSSIYNLGLYAQGNIVNYGWAGSFGDCAEDGIQINFGQTYDIAERATGGIQINFSNTKKLANYSKGGIQINFGEINEKNIWEQKVPTVDMMAFYVEGGIQANLGYVNGFFAHSAEGGLQLNLGKLIGKMGFSTKNPYLKTNKGIQFDLTEQIRNKEFGIDLMVNLYFQSLKTKLHQIEYLRDLKNNPDNALETIRKHNFQEFESDIFELNKIINGFFKNDATNTALW